MENKLNNEQHIDINLTNVLMVLMLHLSLQIDVELLKIGVVNNRIWFMRSYFC